MDLRNEKLTSLSLSIAYLMPFLTATIIMPIYSAAISAKLTVQLPTVPFTDLESFARDGTYKLGSLNNTFPIKYFRVSNLSASAFTTKAINLYFSNLAK